MCSVVYTMLRDVTRTNIDIDDELVQKAMDMYGFRSKKEAVEAGLLELLGGRPMTWDEVLAMEGTGWVGDLASLRRGRFDDEPI
jgi:Arc/MetJ family transcription regulator